MKKLIQQTVNINETHIGLKKLQMLFAISDSYRRILPKSIICRSVFRALSYIYDGFFPSMTVAYKSSKYASDLYFLFVNFKKKLLTSFVCWALRQLDVGEWLARFIQLINRSTQCRVREDDFLSDDHFTIHA